MKKLVRLLLLGMIFAVFSVGGDKDPLFVNLTTDQGHRSLMAVQFSSKMMAKGHPLTIYLNDKGVLLASKKFARYSDVQSKLNDAIKNGAKVYICPVCMQEYGVEGEDLLSGLIIGNADLLNQALFADNTKTMSW